MAGWLPPPPHEPSHGHVTVTIITCERRLLSIQQVPDPPRQPRRRRYCSANWCAGCSGYTVIVFLTCCDSLHFNILTDSGSTSLLHQPAIHSFTHSFVRCNLIWINKGPDLLSMYVFLQGIRDTSSCRRSSLIPSPGDEKGAVCEQCAKIVSSKERRNVCTSLAIRNRKPRVGMDGWDSGVRTCTGEVRNTMGPSWLVVVVVPVWQHLPRDYGDCGAGTADGRGRAGCGPCARPDPRTWPLADHCAAVHWDRGVRLGSVFCTEKSSALSVLVWGRERERKRGEINSKFIGKGRFNLCSSYRLQSCTGMHWCGRQREKVHNLPSMLQFHCTCKCVPFARWLCEWLANGKGNAMKYYFLNCFYERLMHSTHSFIHSVLGMSVSPSLARVIK